MNEQESYKMPYQIIGEEYMKECRKKYGMKAEIASDMQEEKPAEEEDVNNA